MPYKSNSELPKNIKDILPAYAQEIYREAFNHAYVEYKNPNKRRDDSTAEQVAYKVAWNAVKTKYEKNIESGKWQLKK